MENQNIDDRIQAINAQHLALAEQIHLLALLFSKDSPDSVEVVASLKALSGFAAKHFKDEEALMEIVKPTDIELHKRDHVYLLEGISNFIAEFVDGRLSISPQTGTNFVSWLNFHMNKYDNVLFASRGKAVAKSLDLCDPLVSDVTGHI